MSLVTPTMPIETFSKVNHSRTTVLAATWYEAFHVYNIEAIVLIVSQVNTTPQANNIDFRLTVDGEVIEVANMATNNNAYEYLFIMPSDLAPVMGGNPYLDKTALIVGCGYRVSSTLDDVEYYPLKGADVLFEYRLDTVGANQEFHCDFFYIQKGLV